MPDPQFPPLQSKPSSKHCTNCSSTMTLYSLPGHYSGTIEIDVCLNCNVIWFDQNESMQLSPDGTVALFQLIHQRGGTATSTSSKFGEGLRCVTCGEGMRLTHDRVRNTRFSYQACRRGHGRLTTFYNFLSEKQFVRELTTVERAKLAATIHQIRCSGCGAAVDIGKVDACAYCRAPVSVFDREAAKKAIDHYLQERQKQHTVVVTSRETPRGRHAPWSGYERADLGTDILYALGGAASRLFAGGSRAAPVIAGAAATAPTFADGAVQAIPDATSALFGNAAATGGGVLESVSETAISTFGEAASSAGDGVVDLVTDGIGSLLGSLFD